MHGPRQASLSLLDTEACLHLPRHASHSNQKTFCCNPDEEIKLATNWLIGSKLCKAARNKLSWSETHTFVRCDHLHYHLCGPPAMLCASPLGELLEGSYNLLAARLIVPFSSFFSPTALPSLLGPSNPAFPKLFSARLVSVAC